MGVSFSTDPNFPGYTNENPATFGVNNKPSLSGNVPYLANSSQIGDGEQEPGGEPHYAYQVNGSKVQSFWSASTPDVNGNPGAFIVPDGNPQSIYVNPIWNLTGTIPNTSPAITGPVFTGNYDLVVRGTTITVDAHDGLTTVDVDLSDFAFVNTTIGGHIRNITIEPVGPQATVSIFGLDGDQSIVVSGGARRTSTLAPIPSRAP